MVVVDSDACCLFLSEAFFEAVHEMYDLEVPTVESAFACDFDPTRQAFLQEHHPDLTLIVDDVKVFSDLHKFGGVASSVTNCITGKPARLPHSKAFGCGISCTSISNQNAQRKNFKSAVRHGKGSTGETFWHQYAYVKLYKPFFVSLGECPELGAGGGAGECDFEL